MWLYWSIPLTAHLMKMSIITSRHQCQNDNLVTTITLNVNPYPSPHPLKNPRYASVFNISVLLALWIFFQTKANLTLRGSTFGAAMLWAGQFSIWLWAKVIEKIIGPKVCNSFASHLSFQFCWRLYLCHCKMRLLLHFYHHDPPFPVPDSMLLAL